MHCGGNCMTDKSVAVDAIRQQIHKIAIDANLFDIGLADYPHAEACSKKRKKLLEAIQKLEQPTLWDYRYHD